jgi:heme-degrading monooxygenase HmoA
MAVKIMIKRCVPKDKVQDLMPLLEQMRSIASKQSGYIYGETLKSLDAPEEYLVISTWRSFSDWEYWANSAERLSIQHKIDKVIDSPTEYHAYQH